MKKLSVLFCVLFGLSVHAQFITNDPIHTGVTSLIKLFQDPSFTTIVKDIEKLKKVSNSVRQFHRGTQVISTISRCTAKLSTLSEAVSKDGHIYPAEYQLMSDDISKIATAGTNIIKDMKAATSQSGSVLQMTDAERTTFITAAYEKSVAFENAIDTYFSKIRSASLRRSGSRSDVASTVRLYDLVAQAGTGFQGQSQGRIVDTEGYDKAYDDREFSALDSAYTSDQAKEMMERQRQCEVRLQNYYDEKFLVEERMQFEAFRSLMSKGWNYKVKKPEFTLNSILTTNLFSTVGTSYDQANALGQLNSSQGGGAEQNVSATIEDAIDGFVDPEGNQVSNEQFQIYLRIETRQLILDQHIDLQLREKWKLDECSNMSQIFTK